MTFAAVLGALHTFLDYAKQAATHRTAGAAYAQLKRYFDAFFLVLATSTDRQELIKGLSELRDRMDELGRASPLIPPGSYKAAETEIGKLPHEVREEAVTDL